MRLLLKIMFPAHTTFKYLLKELDPSILNLAITFDKLTNPAKRKKQKANPRIA